MKKGFCPVLLDYQVSSNLVNPGETLFVTARWQNQGDRCAPEDYRFFMDGRFGHQRRLEDAALDFRTIADALPGTSRWTPGRTVAVTCRWTAGRDWAGTFHLSLGMMDTDGVPVPFAGANGNQALSQPIGDVDSTWNFGRPWIAENRKPRGEAFQAPAAAQSKQMSELIRLADGIALALQADRPRLLMLEADGHAHFLDCGEARTVLRNREKDALLTEGCKDCRVIWTLTTQDGREAVYHAEAMDGGAKAASFDLRWRVQGREAVMEVLNRKEYAPYELLEVRYDTLAELGQGYLLDFYGAGREVPIKSAAPICFEKKYDVRNAAALYDERALILVESAHIDSLLTTGVIETDGVRRGIIGGSAVCRVRAVGETPSIPVAGAPSFAIELPDLSGEKPGWQTAARLWQRGLERNPAFELYRSTFFYKQLSTWGPQPDERWRADPAGTTQNLFRAVPFAQIAKNARQFAALTDQVRQILYIAGWQEHGFDTDYPEPYGADPRCGGLSALSEALGSGREDNIVMSLHDNFDDISAEHADCPYAALDESGQPWRGWAWAGGMTTIMGLKKYVDAGAARARVERMMQMLPLQSTYHLDVLSAEVCRYDFDPEHPASAQDSHDAKLRIIELFNQHGLDVTSEMLSHAFVGKIGFALHTRIDRASHPWQTDSFVPLVQRIYHGTIGYCAPSRTTDELLWGILLGGQTFYEEDIAGELCVSRYYLQNVPSMLLYGRKMLNFSMESGVARADYEGDSYVEADFERSTYKAVVDGRLIGCDFTTLAPGNHPGVFLAYSLGGGEMRYGVPPELGEGELMAVCLTPDGPGGRVGVRCEDGELVLDMPAKVPVRVTIA